MSGDRVAIVASQVEPLPTSFYWEGNESQGGPAGATHVTPGVRWSQTDASVPHGLSCPPSSSGESRHSPEPKPSHPVPGARRTRPRAGGREDGHPHPAPCLLPELGGPGSQAQGQAQTAATTRRASLLTPPAPPCLPTSPPLPRVSALGGGDAGIEAWTPRLWGHWGHTKGTSGPEREAPGSVQTVATPDPKMQPERRGPGPAVGEGVHQDGQGGLRPRHPPNPGACRQDFFTFSIKGECWPPTRGGSTPARSLAHLAAPTTDGPRSGWDGAGPERQAAPKTPDELGMWGPGRRAPCDGMIKEAEGWGQGQGGRAWVWVRRGLGGADPSFPSRAEVSTP